MSSGVKRTAGSNALSATETIRDDFKRQKSEDDVSSAASTQSRLSSEAFSASTAEISLDPTDPGIHSVPSSPAENYNSHTGTSPHRQRCQRRRHRNQPNHSTVTYPTNKADNPLTHHGIQPSTPPCPLPNTVPPDANIATAAGHSAPLRAPLAAQEPALPLDPVTTVSIPLDPSKANMTPQPIPAATQPDSYVNTSNTRALSSSSNFNGQRKKPAADISVRSALIKGMQREPDTRPISLPQLVHEVKGIYVGLVMVETKCIQVDAEQGASLNKDEPLSPEHWQALIALHRTLLHEHHDFMLASQHPSGTEPLRRLAQKYAMPARMWRHGIHSFLELLRHRLPASREHMISFIYLAYSMMALLFETVPAFSDIFVECLGDLSRYRMAIEDENLRVRDTWTNVSRRWYLSASDHAPTTGRLYHHLAILARPRLVEQLFYYVKSLCVPIPFVSTKDSIQTLLDPFIKGRDPEKDDVDANFTHAHALLFKQLQHDRAPEFEAVCQRCVGGLDREISRRSKAWIQTGVHYAIVSCGALMGYGSDDNVFVQCMKTLFDGVVPNKAIDADDGEANGPAAISKTITSATKAVNWDMDTIRQALGPALSLFAGINKVVVSRLEDTNCYGYVYVLLTWLISLASLQGGAAMPVLEKSVPWESLVHMLNYIMAQYTVPTGNSPKTNGPATYERIESHTLLCSAYQLERAAEARRKANGEPEPLPSPPPPASCDADSRPLPEDWSLRGLLWTTDLYPKDFFKRMDDCSMDDEERMMESPSVGEFRKERILWLAWRIAQHKKWILYDAATHSFATAEAFRSQTIKTKALTSNLADEISLESEEKIARMELEALDSKRQ